MISESAFQAALEVALNSPTRSTRVQRINSGDVFIESHSGRRRFRGAGKGTGDLVGLVGPDGLHIEIEAKSATGRLSEAQECRGGWLRRMGAAWVPVWADKYDLDKSVRDALEEIDRHIEAARKRRALS